MIGNDVVDLKAAAKESNWRRKGFLEKVFTARERETLSSFEDQHLMVWLLWSMKEAAYKARQRQFSLSRSLDWHSLECSIEKITPEKASGEVRIGGISYFTDSDITSERVHTSAGNQKNIPFKNEVFEASSEAVKKELLRCTANFLSLPVKELSFRKNSYGVPCISSDNRKIFDQFSFSDHGRFAAFSLSLRYS